MSPDRGQLGSLLAAVGRAPGVNRKGASCDIYKLAAKPKKIRAYLKAGVENAEMCV